MLLAGAGVLVWMDSVLCCWPGLACWCGWLVCSAVGWGWRAGVGG